MHPFALNVLKTVKKYGMLQPGDRVLVGVSGGADSLALLHVLREIRPEVPLALVVAHVDHGLRPAGREEAAFVRRIAAELGLTFVSCKADVAARQRKDHLSLQEAAREERYAFFLKAAHSRRAARIALGHTADDQAESVVMRFLRGSGTRGLSGIPPVRGGIFIRPLIERSRKEVEAFLTERKIAWLSDPSNAVPRFLRNQVRHELLPLLEQYNPRLRRGLVEMAGLFRAEEEFWQKLLEERFPRLLRNRKRDSITLDIPALQEESLPLRFRAYRQAVDHLAGHLRRISLTHILTVESLVQNPEPNKRLELPRGLAVEKAYHALTFRRGRQEAPPFEYLVEGPGYVDLPEIGRGMRFLPVEKGDPRSWGESSSVAWLDYEAACFPLTVRSFRPGDRFQPLGMEGEKKVKDFFIECKIPAAHRKRIPLLYKKEHLLWVAGLRLDHRARVKPESKRVLRVEFL